MYIFFRSTQKRSRAEIWMENDLNFFANIRRHFSCLAAKFIPLMPVYLAYIYSSRSARRDEEQVQVQEHFLRSAEATNLIYRNKFNRIERKMRHRQFSRGEWRENEASDWCWKNSLMRFSHSTENRSLEEKWLTELMNVPNPLHLFPALKSLKSISPDFVSRDHQTYETILIKLRSNVSGITTFFTFN